MLPEEIVEQCKRHTFFTWKAQADAKPIPIASAQGAYVTTHEGKRLLDFNSQAMSVNIGHNHPRVKQAITQQMETLQFVSAANATEVRARLGKKLSEICPANINKFLFTLGGAEANENAVKLARAFTGKQKILSRYRSYHGATQACMQLTGDPRRLKNEPGGPGYVKVFDPWPYDFSFGKTDAEIVNASMRYLEEVIMYEGAGHIAAMIVEPVTGTNGVLVPPEGYLEALAALLKKKEILLICDEVMSGFGRTGKMFAVNHWGIEPDLLCMAKGLTSSYLPLGAVGIGDTVAEHFENNVYWGGLTFNSHPLCLAAAEANIAVLQDEDLIGNSARLGKVMRKEMEILQAKHPSVKTSRNIGLFGMIDFQRNTSGELLGAYDSTPNVLKAFQHELLQKGVMAFCRWSHMTCIPPLCISEQELRDGFQRISDSLHILDEVVVDA